MKCELHTVKKGADGVIETLDIFTVKGGNT